MTTPSARICPGTELELWDRGGAVNPMNVPGREYPRPVGQRWGCAPDQRPRCDLCPEKEPVKEKILGHTSCETNLSVRDTMYVLGHI